MSDNGFFIRAHAHTQSLPRIPRRQVATPESAARCQAKAPNEVQIKWLITGWDKYCNDEQKHMWRRLHTNQQGRRKGWKHIRAIEKNKGYRGFNLWRTGKRYYFSVIQLRLLLYLNPGYV